MRGVAPQIIGRARAIGSNARLATSAISYGEIMLGGIRGQDSLPAIRAFFAAVDVHPFDRAAADAYARLPFRRANFDRLIAAHALALGATLVSADRGAFADIPGLHVEDWTV